MPAARRRNQLTGKGRSAYRAAAGAKRGGAGPGPRPSRLELREAPAV